MRSADYSLQTGTKRSATSLVRFTSPRILLCSLWWALLAGSPAIDAGNNALAVDASGAPLVTDQRGPGFARINGFAVDIGAFEA
jgi:hypothetical protein